MSLHKLLTVLADGQFHSGDVLGEMLGVSRTAVWKQLQKAQDLGLPLESVKGKGYCVHGGLDLLSFEAITDRLSCRALSLISSLAVEQTVTSTSDEVMAKALVGSSGYVCTAEQQTSGKGRRGRTWVSPYAGNLYVSTCWRFTEGVASIEGLSLAVGVAIIDALKSMGIEGAQLKWPNDVLYEGRKLAGVLLEVVGDMSGPCQVIVGIGINVRMPMQVNIDQPWIDLYSIDASAANRNRMLAVLLNELMPLLADFEGQGFAAYRDRWQALDAYANEHIQISMGSNKIGGKARGVDISGALLLETSEGIQSFSGGEISVRKVE